MTSATMSNGAPGDFDNGMEAQPDGSYINKPDDYYQARNGNNQINDQSAFTGSANVVPPNRQVYSPIMFGSLPAGHISPWRTLLFCNNPAAGRSHPGFASPRDHLLMDFFTMPVVAPYVISEPFSTAGRVNINFEMAPFTYIHRDTAFRGVLKSTRITAYPTQGLHKTADQYGTMTPTIYRKEIDGDQTTAAFYTRFGQSSTGTFSGDKGAFRTASEICDMPLVPLGTTAAGLNNFWSQNQYTGDNAREATYGQIYSRITSRSNVFTVHIRAQTLRKAKLTAGLSAADKTKMYAEWDESKDQVVGEYRGSSTIERYIDPSDPNLPDFATTTNASMDDYYKFRVVGTKRFNP
jgi:uncharacterized protein (TIGR02600 family)